MTTAMTVQQRTIAIVGAVFAISLLALALIIPFYANAAYISQTLDIGDSNADVTTLQTYLAQSTIFYPEALITGYFGQLTKAGVERFQSSHGIVTSGTPETTGYGRVGPLTLAKLNSVLGSGNPGSNVSWDSVPVLSNPTVTYTNTTATFAWTTNEQTTGQVYWNTSPLAMNEATGPRQQPYVSGTLASDGGSLQTGHTIVVSNLQPNTTYYYLVRSTDSVGSMSMIWPRSFRTNN